ncbi:MAG: hypothetical protein K8R02_10040 [Anaerohalosphaeraceae bacterium]|nr:hypothetical protein [Anaerohalosphaeraceae bacterium]
MGKSILKKQPCLIPVVIAAAILPLALALWPLVSYELHIMPMFSCALKHIFDGNNNITLLSKKEIVKKIKNAFQENKSIIKSVRK